MSKVIQHLRSAGLLPEGADLTDGQLLERFVSRRETAARRSAGAAARPDDLGRSSMLPVTAATWVMWQRMPAPAPYGIAWRRPAMSGILWQ